MKSIKEIVQNLIKEYRTNDPFEIAAEKNIVVLFEPLGNTLGYYQMYKRIQFIHINCELNETNQIFVCGHELGHAICHPKVSTPFLKANTFFSADKIEIEANTFAVELLLPDEKLYELHDTNLSISEACTMYGIPKEVHHLKDYKSII